MPVDFLTAEQRARYGSYGSYGEDPTPEQLARCFHPTIANRELIDKGKSDRARLGCAVQLGTVRFLGTAIWRQPSTTYARSASTCVKRTFGDSPR